MPVRRNNYIGMELEWLEDQANKMKDFVDSHPITRLKDRMHGAKAIATIEQQHKNIRDTLKDYALLIEAISKLRESEDKKSVHARGDLNLSPMESGLIK